MDPNATLTRIREHVSTILDASNDQYEMALEYGADLAEAVENLDEWLTGGGFIPAAWCEHATKENSGEMATITYRHGDKTVTAYVPPF